MKPTKKINENVKEQIKKIIKPHGEDFIARVGEEGWTYIKTVVDIVREPILILDKDLKVIAANEPFYNVFQVEPKGTENKVVYELGNGQWDIPALRKLLEAILPKNTFFKGFEVTHEFPFIGHKVMILNARQMYIKDDPILGPCPPIILLAIEDVTEIMGVAETLSRHTNQFQADFTARTKKMEKNMIKLEKEIAALKKKR